MINESFYDSDKLREEIHSQLTKCQKIIEKDFFTIGLGGIESWLVCLSAIEKFGINNVLAVNIYSVFSNSQTPNIIASTCLENNIPYIDIDISEAIQKTLSLPIGLMRVDSEKLHYTMSEIQKADTIATLRNTVLRAISDRQNAILLTGISLSKIKTGWASPYHAMYDWNPLVNCSHYQVQLAVANHDIGVELLQSPSGLDLMTNGGPFPTDYKINLTSDDFIKDFNDQKVKDKLDKINNFGYGCFQRKDK